MVTVRVVFDAREFVGSLYTGEKETRKKDRKQADYKSQMNFDFVNRFLFLCTYSKAESIPASVLQNTVN